MKRAVLVFASICSQFAWAQSASDVSNGQAFANSLAPTSASQVVNPSGVSASAWGSQTGTPTSVPAGLGGFSSPTNDSTLLSNAQSTSLTAMGNKAMLDCANYVAGSDQYQNQYCAAVNFLNNACMQPTTGEASVLGKTGTNQGSSANCAGSYGAGQSQFNFSDQVTSTDSMFNVISSLGSTAGGVLQQTCSPQTVVSQPAQYANNTCVVSNDTQDDTCSQTLNVSAVNSSVAATTAQVGCVAPWVAMNPNNFDGGGSRVLGCAIVAPNSLNLQTGDVYDGLVIFHQDTSNSYGGSYKNGWNGYYNMPPDSWNDPTCAGQGYTLNCIKYLFNAAGYSYGGSDDNNVAVWYSDGTGLSCPDGATLNGDQCTEQKVQTNWTDNCGSFTGGQALPAPTQ